MPKTNKLKAVALTEEKNLKTLVENRTAFTLENCELNIFETHQRSAMVPLTFNDLVVTSMMRGKKVMHLHDTPTFDYLPGQSVLVPAGVTMEIDFPDATQRTPTQCIALAIDGYKIQNTLNYLNERYPREGAGKYWQLGKKDFHLFNSAPLAQAINKLVGICSSASAHKDVLADLALQELLVNLIQQQNANALSAPAPSNDSPLAYIAHFIKENINAEIRTEVLSAQACMSKATFYRAFKREFGISPNEYIISERIKKAKVFLTKSGATIKSICHECGFTDVNYFTRLFKNIEGITPKQYQLLAKGPKHDVN